MKDGRSRLNQPAYIYISILQAIGITEFYGLIWSSINMASVLRLEMMVTTMIK